MVAPVAQLGQAARFGHTQVRGNGGEPGDYREAIAERHPDGALLKGTEKFSAATGEGMFQAMFGVGALGFIFRNSIGKLNKNWGANVGRYTAATFEAADSVTLGQVFDKAGRQQLKANYYKLSSDYVSKNAGEPSAWVGKVRGFLGMSAPKVGAHVAKNKETAARLLAKSEALGGAHIAKAEWKGFAKLGSYLMKQGAFSTVMAGGLALAAGTAMARSGKHAVDGMHDLQIVAKDLTGQDVTIPQIVNKPDSLPPIIRDMRENLMTYLKTDSAEALAQAIEKGSFAAMGGPLAHSAGGMFGAPMAGMMGGMMLGQAAHSLAPSVNFVETYLSIKDMKDAGQSVPAEMYAELMAATSKEVRKLGGVTSEQVQRIATQYAEEGVSAKQIVTEVFNHRPFVERAHKVALEMEAEKEAQEPLNKALAEEAELDEPEAEKEEVNEEKELSADNVNEAPESGNLNRAPDLAVEGVRHEGKMQAAQSLGRGGAA